MTKEFLQLKKTYEDSLAFLIVVKKAKIRGDQTFEALPEKFHTFVENVKDLDEAERVTLTKMSDLRNRMAILSPQIRKLSDQLQPYFSKEKQTERTATTTTTTTGKSDVRK